MIIHDYCAVYAGHPSHRTGNCCLRPGLYCSCLTFLDVESAPKVTSQFKTEILAMEVTMFSPIIDSTIPTSSE